MARLNVFNVQQNRNTSYLTRVSYHTCGNDIGCVYLVVYLKDILGTFPPGPEWGEHLYFFKLYYYDMCRRPQLDGPQRNRLRRCSENPNNTHVDVSCVATALNIFWLFGYVHTASHGAQSGFYFAWMFCLFTHIRSRREHGRVLN